MEPVYLRAAATFGLIKGAVIAATTSALGIAFWQALVIAFVSGLLGMFGALGAAFIAARESRKTRGVVHDVKRKLGVDRRAEDRETT